MGGADITENHPESELKAEPESEEEGPAETLPKFTLEIPRSLSPPPTPPSSPAEELIQPEVRDTDFQDKHRARTNGPCCFCVSQMPELPGDKKVDKIIEYVHQNLEEAGKALATLGENFEHDLKLMFVDILGRIQQWIGIVQNKLDACRNEINNLRKELLARACEIDIKTREITNLKAQITDHQNMMKEYEKNGLETSIHDKQAGQRIFTAPLTENAQARSFIESAEAQSFAKDVMEVGDEKDKVNEKDEVEEINGYRFSKKRDDEKKITLPMEDIIHENATVQTIIQERERIKRESELESEVTRLRKENDRIVKERAEYEHAIQRALLRGVSSLNVEALRVLRCPPIPCCTPCAPCPTTLIVPPEPVVPCPTKSIKKRPGSATVCSTKISYDRNAKNDNQISNIKQPCTSSCYSANTSQKSENNMIFLLRQSDTGSLCTDKNMASVCESPIIKTIEIPPLPRFGA